MHFINTYAALPAQFYRQEHPVKVSAPDLFLWNAALAQQLHINTVLSQDVGTLAEVFSGNTLLEGMAPITCAYAGHQFGHFNPQLGDGRAHLLGEVVDTFNQSRDIQLKGSGRTYFSRGGDGRCALKPAIREYIMSEAMAALGIETARTLAVVTTGETVYREERVPGAVVTRIAASHIRVGTFQYFAAQHDIESLRILSDYTIKRHFPFIKEEGAQKYLALIDAVITKQITLVVDWMRVGFIHGVMNTDNTAISGETIDYGPCAMMGTYHPNTVFSSIDQQGRYAFGNQPDIIQWNMARFVESLLPLINEDTTVAIELARPFIVGFPAKYKTAFMKMMGRKIGIDDIQAHQHALVFELLTVLESKKLDYTQTFHTLTQALSIQNTVLTDDLSDWYARWYNQISDKVQAFNVMKKVNPVVIPRNHHVEAVLEMCQQTGCADAAEAYLNVLRTPYEEKDVTLSYQDASPETDMQYQTFCGT